MKRHVLFRIEYAGDRLGRSVVGLLIDLPYIGFYTFSYMLSRWKQALEVFMKVERMSPRPDHEVCYYLGNIIFM